MAKQTGHRNSRTRLVDACGCQSARLHSLSVIGSQSALFLVVKASMNTGVSISEIKNMSKFVAPD